MSQLELPLERNREIAPEPECRGGYGWTPEGSHDYSGGPIKGRLWCIKLGCGKFEPKRIGRRKR